MLWNKFVWIPFLAVIFFAGAVFAQTGLERVIEAEGIAAVTLEGNDGVLRARDEAVKRALRRSVEQGVGTLIDSESLTQNFQLLNDEIYSQVKGYVRQYDIISDNKGADQIYRIKIRATVVLARLEKDLKALNIIKKQKGNPRVMVLFREMVDQLDRWNGGMIQGSIAQIEMEKVFLNKGFPLVDKGQLGAIKQRDVTLSYTDPAKAAALGQRFGAEVVIVGEASSDLVDHSSPYGASVYFYQAQVSARAIKVDTATVIAVDSVQSDWRNPGEGQGSGRLEAARESLSSAGRKLADKMIVRILERWRSEVFNTVSIQIVATDVTGKRRREFKKELKEIRGVESVDERNFTNRVMTIDVEVEGSIWKDFDERLESFKTVGVELTGKTQNRIEVSLFDLDE